MMLNIPNSDAATSRFLVICAAVLLCCPMSAVAAHPPREIGLDKQLFVDEDMVASIEGAEFTLNPARRAERVITASEPWESSGLGFCTYVKQGDLFQMWYMGWEYDEAIKGHWMSRILYAESPDGIRWTKPHLGQIEYRGSKDNNIIAVGYKGYGHGQSVFVDANAKSPAEKYKMIFGDFYRVRPKGAPGYTTVSGAVSPDGIHWTKVDTKHGVIMPAGTDTQNVAFYDPNIEKYVAFVRHNIYGKDESGKQHGSPCRAVARSESDDFCKFPAPKLIMKPDERDPSISSGGLYNSAAMIYPFAPKLYLFFPSFMEKDTAINIIQFAAGRDGVRVDRRFREPYVPINPNARRLGKQIAYTAYMGTGMVRVGDEIWQYGIEMDVPHDGAWYGRRVPGGIQRYVQRLDGFISLDARRGPGRVTTKPFVLRGNTLELNADASLAPAVKGDAASAAAASELTVEVLDGEGRVLAASRPLHGDGAALTPVWKERKDLGDLIDKTVSLRFTMRMAKLYAFKVVNRGG